MENAKDMIQQQVIAALQTLGISNTDLATEVTKDIMRQTVYWEKPLPDNERLIFVRLFSPVVMREEVFLGNVLFNDFLAKVFARVVIQTGGQASLVANDLENYYFLLRTTADLPVLANELGNEVERNLPELFFGEPDPQRGIYGSLSHFFSGTDSRMESFPVYAVPEFLTLPLEQRVRQHLLNLLRKEDLEKYIKIVVTTFAFLYGRSSGGSGDAQSFANFVYHLATESSYGGLITVEKVKKVFNITSVSKETIKESFDNAHYSTKDLKDMLVSLLNEMGKQIDAGDKTWLLPFVIKDQKLVKISKPEYRKELLSIIHIGHLHFEVQGDGFSNSNLLECRLCGVKPTAARNSMVLLGTGAFLRHNQRVRRPVESDPIACLRCALFSWLQQKLLGTTRIPIGGSPPKLPMVPKSYNLIFHYGRHSDEEVAHLAQQIDRVWELVSKHRAAEVVSREIEQARRILAQKAEKEQDAKKRAALEAELEQKETELQQAQAAVAQVEDNMLADFPWMRDLGASPVPSENPALDIVGNLQLSESKVERHVLGLGMGSYRMILFVLPQIRPPRDKGHEFSQSRFSNSWITVTAFLSFLNHLCGCDGPFYYQSLPMLSPEALQSGLFYVRNQAIRAEEVQRRYAAIYDLAWKLVWQRGPEGFVKKVVLAEKLLADPMGTFSAVMRNSLILGQRKGGSYKRLKAEYRQDWGAQDLTEYARFIQQFTNLLGGESYGSTSRP